jgi:hypothetical protein
MSAAIPITRLDRTASELRSFASKCGDGPQVRRIRAIALVLEGRFAPKRRCRMAWTGR